jgi:protocatechuate 3,4-dioxygenase beta subunit
MKRQSRIEQQGRTAAKGITLRDRRMAMKAFGGGALALFACGGTGLDDLTDAGSDAGGTPGTGGTTGIDTGTPASCTVAPTETIGPYPDKTGMLTNAAYHRRDITEGRAGLPLDVVLSIVNKNAACAAIPDAAVIVWQCDADGHYSEYGNQPGGYDGTGATYLRGVQTSDTNGQVTFRTIYPGWYQGRATHIHIQVFINGVSKMITQLAFPETVTAGVYATGVYAAKGNNPQSNASDMVFADSLAEELANLTGDTTAGYTATLTIGLAL